MDIADCFVGCSGRTGRGSLLQWESVIGKVRRAEYQLLCVGYIKGVADTSDGKSWEGYPYCIGGVITGQLQKIVIKYMNEHPEDLHLAAYSLVQSAFLEAFPCED